MVTVTGTSTVPRLVVPRLSMPVPSLISCTATVPVITAAEAVETPMVSALLLLTPATRPVTLPDAPPRPLAPTTAASRASE